MSKGECLTSKGPAGLNPLVRLLPLTVLLKVFIQIVNL